MESPGLQERGRGLTRHLFARRLLQILLLVCPVVAAAQSTAIEGRVVLDGDSSPLPGATVAWSVGTKLLTVQTDARGAFSLPPSTPMPQRIAVTKAGFVTQTAPLGAVGSANEVRLRRVAIAAGTVRDPASVPVTNAAVTLHQLTDSGVGPSWTVTTDDRGEFRSTELPAGRYRVNASGRVTLTGLGPASEALSDAVTVDLRPGETTPIMLIHRRAAKAATGFESGAISGIVLDAFGEPAVGIAIRVFRGRKSGAFRYLAPVGGVWTTDDTGRYRVFDLEPGKYVVQATDERSFITLLGADVDAPVYYPSAVVAPDAVQLRVAAGQDVGGIDIRLRRESYVKVSGTIVQSEGWPGPSVALVRRGPPGAWLEPAVSSSVTAAGAFEFPKVVPGDYIVQTSARLLDPQPFVISAVSDVEGLVLRTTVPRTLFGRIEQTDPIPNRSQFRLAFLSVDPELNLSANGLVASPVASDWAFSVSGPYGMGRLVLASAPQGWFIKTVRNGSSTPGYEPIDPGNGAELTIVLGRATGVIEGAVRERGVPDRELHAVAFSRDERLWYERSPYVASTRANNSRRFAMPPLPPGDYYVVAVDAGDVDVRTGEQLEPQMLRQLTDGAIRVSVRDGTRQQVAVGVASAR